MIRNRKSGMVMRNGEWGFTQEVRIANICRERKDAGCIFSINGKSVACAGGNGGSRERGEPGVRFFTTGILDVVCWRSMRCDDR